MTSCTRLRTAWLLLLLLCLPVRADEVQALEEFLIRLGLNELRLHQMERALAAEVSPDKRLADARKLADAYAAQLVAVADEPQRFASLQRRVQKLLAEFPEAVTPAIDVVLLQAEYQRAEALVIRWMEEPRERSPLAEAAAVLDRIAPLLASRQKELSAAVDQRLAELEVIKSEQQRAIVQQQLERQQAVAARAGYFAGWSHYYLGVARNNRQPSVLSAAKDPPAHDDFDAAKEQFLKLLEIGEVDDLLEPDELGLASIWRARAVIGLGLAELGLHRTEVATRVFRWLQHSSVPPVIRDQAAYWQTQGMLNVGLAEEASQFVASQVDLFTGAASPGKSSLCLAAVRMASTLDPASAHAQRLIEHGIRGLARMRQFETLDKLIEQYELEQGPLRESFQLSWLRGRRQYLAAEKSKSADDFRAAAETLATALARLRADESGDRPRSAASQAKLPAAPVAETGQARYYLAWCRFRLGQLEPAATLFQEAATALRGALPDLAVQAAWMRCTCLVQLAAKEKRHVTAAMNALSAFQKDYPGSKEAQRASLLLVRLRQTTATPEESIRELSTIGPSDPNYLFALSEICQLQHGLWVKAKGDPAKVAPIAAELLQAADRFLAASKNEDDWEQRLKVRLLAVDVLAAAQAPDLGRIAALLRDGAREAAQLAPNHPLAIEFQYRRLQLAQHTGDRATAASAAEVIAEQGRGTPFELPALVIMAQAADDAVKTAGQSEKVARVQEAASVYGRLVELLGDSPHVLASNSNALAAASKLAQYDEELGRWAAAADRLARLVQAQPKDRRLRRRAGLASWHAGRHEQALEHWRTLLAGLPGGSEDWLEAKYYQLACLIQTNRAAAESVWKQFQLLYPEVKSDVWGPKFRELATQFE